MSHHERAVKTIAKLLYGGWDEYDANMKARLIARIEGALGEYNMLVEMSDSECDHVLAKVLRARFTETPAQLRDRLREGLRDLNRPV